MDFDLARLRVLIAVGRHGTMAGAASELSYSPSAISQQIRRLEAEVRVPVVERQPRGVRLTEAGEAIVTRGEAIFDQLLGLRNDLDDLAGMRAGSLRLGVFPTFAASLLPAVLLEFKRRHPAVELSVHSSRAAPLREQLLRRDVDLGLVWDYPWTRSEDPELVRDSLLVDPTVLLVPAEHPLTSEKTVDVGWLKGESWVVRADAHPTRDVMERTVRARGFAAPVRAEANDYPEMQAMVAAGLGVAMCPALATQPLRGDVVVKALDGSVPQRRISVARPAESRPSPPHEAMLDVMRAVARQWDETSS